MSVPQRPVSGIHARILAVLRAHPEGISINEMRVALGLEPEGQQHLDRRVRQLDRTHIIQRKRVGKRTLYILAGEKEVSQEAPAVDRKTRAKIIFQANGRCEMCGRSVSQHGIVLEVDHRLPLSWGGGNEDSNLWALCGDCNQGKKAFFATITDPRVQRAMSHQSVHVRLGELLKHFAGQPVPKEYLELVAWTHDDWEKRLRELRVLGWEYRFIKRKGPTGRTDVSFVLDHWEPWPPGDPAALIRKVERDRGPRR